MSLYLNAALRNYFVSTLLVIRSKCQERHKWFRGLKKFQGARTLCFPRLYAKT